MADTDATTKTTLEAGSGPRIGVVLAALALVGTLAAGVLAWQSQREVDAAEATLVDLKWRWTMAQRDLESTTAQIATMRALDEAEASTRRKTEGELRELEAEVARLQRDIAALRQQLGRTPAPSTPPPDADFVAPVAPEGPAIAQLTVVDDGTDAGPETPPAAALRPVNPFVFPDSTVDAPVATLTPRELQDDDAELDAMLPPPPPAMLVPPPASLTPPPATLTVPEPAPTTP